MTTNPTSGAADRPEALRSIQRFEVVDCIDDKHVPAVIPKPHGPWVRYEDHIAALAGGQATAAQQGAAYAAQPSYEHQRAIMEGERNASLDAYSRVVSITSAESRLYEAGFTNGWDRRDRLAAYGQAPAPAAVAGPSRQFTDGTRSLRQDCISAIRDFASSRPEDDEDWESWFEAAFGLCESRLSTIFDEHAAAPTTQPAPQQEAQEPVALLSDDVVRDAVRYRWLREGNDAKHGAAWHVAVNLYGCEWDAAIDAAIAAQGDTP